jgi:hypothetical protein
MRPTLVFVRAFYADGSLVHCPGDECPPHLFAREVIARALDDGALAECDSSDRRSIYRLLHSFNGCKEPEQLTNEERNNLCI